MGAPSAWDTVWKVVSIVFVILALVAVIIGAALSVNADAIQRFGLRATEGSEVGGKLWGPLTMDSNNNEMTFKFRTVGLSSVVALHLRGPMVLGSETGPIAAVLCGGPSPLPACDTSVTGEIPPTTVRQVWDGVTPTAQDMRLLMNRVRADPHLYYVDVLTTAFPGGALRAPLQSISGLP